MHLSISLQALEAPYNFGRFVAPHLYRIDYSVRIYANPLSPFTEAVTVPFQIFLVVCRHMFCNGAVLPGASFQTTMGSNAVMIVENFNSGIVVDCLD